MFRPRVIPCLLLQGKGIVKTVQFSEPRYIGDPMNAVKIFNDFDADELVFLDIDASKEGRSIDVDFVKKVGQEAFMPFAVGGGLRSIQDIRNIFNAGAEKAVICSSALENPDFITQAAEVFGSQAIVVCIDVRTVNGNYRAYTMSGGKKIETDVVALAKKLEKLGAGEIIIQSIDADGMMSGYDVDLIQLISAEVRVPVIALGGAGELADFTRAVEAGASAVAAGSLFVYAGKNKGILINYPDRSELADLFVDILK